MSKKESSLFNMIMALLLISAVAAAALAGVYVLTKPAIDQEQAKKKQEAMAAVLPNFSGNIESVKVLLPGDKDSVVVNVAKNEEGTLFGAAVETYTNKAFAGTFTLMVGFDANGKILGSEVIAASETPGLGDKIDKAKSPFSTQFVSVNPSEHNFDVKVKKDDANSTIDAITAATISSRAYCDAVNRAAKAFAAIQKPSSVSSADETATEKKGVDNE